MPSELSLCALILYPESVTANNPEAWINPAVVHATAGDSEPERRRGMRAPDSERGPSCPTRYLTVVADDFGIGPATSRGILDLAAKNLVTGTVLIVNSPYAEEAVRAAVSELDRAAKKGVIHKNNAARRKSRLMKQLNAK